MKTILQYSCALLLGLNLFPADGSAQPFSALLFPKNSLYYGINLQGPVKSVHLKYTAVNDSLSRPEKKRFAHNNDITGSPYYAVFNESGWLIRSLGGAMPTEYVADDDKRIENYEWDIKDMVQKGKYTRTLKSYYPVMDHNLLLHVNYSNFGDDDSIRNRYSNEGKFAYDEAYDYRYDKSGNIIEELNYSTFREDKKLAKPKPQQQDLFTRKTFVYNAKNQVVIQKILAGAEEQASQRGYTDLNTSCGFCDDLQLKYNYDSSGRIIQIVMFGCGTIIEQQDYSYHSVKDYVEQVKYHVTGAGSFNYPSQNFIRTFNEHGDVIKTAFLNDNPQDAANETRYYTYEYDRHNNWVRCNLFLQGMDQGAPTLIAERKIEYYGAN